SGNALPQGTAQRSHPPKSQCFQPSHPPHQLPRARGIAPVANLQVQQLLSQRPGPNLVTVRRLHPIREFPIPLVVGVRVRATARFAVRVPAVPPALGRTEHFKRPALAAARAFLTLDHATLSNSFRFTTSNPLAHSSGRYRSNAACHASRFSSRVIVRPWSSSRWHARHAGTWKQSWAFIAPPFPCRA